MTNSLVGAGASHYTFGDRNNRDLGKYFDAAKKCFRSLALICDKRTLVVQMVAFADPIRQLPRYLEMLDSAGYKEVYVAEIPAKGSALKTEERLWRQVPNRKWYASQRGPIGASKEVVLFHRVAT